MSKKKGDKKDKAGKKKDPVSLSELSPVLTQAARSLRTALSRNLSEAGLYAGQDGVILQLDAEPGLTPGQLAQRLGVKAPTMTRTIGRMESQGFLERRSDGSDARITKIHLSEAGRQSVERIHQAISDCSPGDPGFLRQGPAQSRETSEGARPQSARNRGGRE